MSDLPRIEIDNLSVQSNPLKYLGYRDFTKLVAGSPDYFVLRKFETLAARTALYLQDVVAELEQRLVEMDEDASQRGETNINNGTFREDILDERIQLVRVDIPNALEKYYSFVTRYSHFVDHPKPDPNVLKDVRNYLNDRKVIFNEGAEQGPIDKQEIAYIADDKNEGDLIAVQPSRRSPMRRFLERLARAKISKSRFPSFHLSRRKKPDGSEKGGTVCDPGNELTDFVVWATDETVDRVAGFLTGFISLCMLVGPLWILNFMQATNGKLGVITGFLVLFYLMMSFATSAKTPETVAAVSAYSAVLTVFLTIRSDSSN